jgi:hypothetical protein
MAITTSCPLPSNINPLSSNGFNFSITKLPEVSFFCQEVNLPGMTLPAIDMNTPLSLVPFAGDIITYDDLTIQFIIDENMTNYKAIYNWLVGLGFPSDNDQFSNFINSQETGYSRTSREYSDASLSILGSNNLTVSTVKFIDILPINLSSMTFQSTSTDVQYIVGNATFKISRYEFV